LETVRWRKALEAMAPLARVHAGPETAKAYGVLKEHYPDVEVFGYATGARRGMWTAPAGWVVRRGRLLGPDDEVLADYERHPLYLYAFSPPFQGTVSREVLETHLMSDPVRPDVIPFHFRNQYRPHEAEWGFCLPHRVRERLAPGLYRVEIDTVFVDAELQMALQTHAGDSPDSFLFVGHFDHPAQAGDGLIGCLAAHEALTRLSERRTRLTYRALSTIEIVGSVFYAGDRAKRDGIREALFTASAGVPAPLIYARTAQERAAVDRAMAHVLRHQDEPSTIVPFRGAIGNDEVAYDVSGIDIPCGSLMRWPFSHYHSSEDTADRVVDSVFESFVRILMRLIDIFENNAVLSGRFEGLPQLAHPSVNLYLPPPTMSGIRQNSNATVTELLGRLPDHAIPASEEGLSSTRLRSMMDLLPALADGRHTTLMIAERLELPFAVVDAYTDMWVERGLMEKTWISPFGSDLSDTSGGGRSA
jgi:aminopeptidase-like protein